MSLNSETFFLLYDGVEHVGQIDLLGVICAAAIASKKGRRQGAGLFGAFLIPFGAMIESLPEFPAPPLFAAECSLGSIRSSYHDV